MPRAVAASSAPAAWGEEQPGRQESVPHERLRPHFPNRTLWRTRGRRRDLRPAILHAPPRRENAGPLTRAHEHRPRTRQRARAPSSDDPSPEPEPPPVEGWRGLAAASVRMQTRLARRRAKWVET
jgi:hypothetical protein